MTALNKLEERLLRRLLKKMISGTNGQQMHLFSTLYELDEQVHYEDNDATRQHWYRKWFELAFAPAYKMGERTPRIGDKVIYSHAINPLQHRYGRITGVAVDWDDGSRTTICSPTMIKVCD